MGKLITGTRKDVRGMCDFVRFPFLILLLTASTCHCGAAAGQRPDDTTVPVAGHLVGARNLVDTRVFFPSLADPSSDPVVAEIGAAKKSIWLIGTDVATMPLARALYQAHERGVAINCLTDKFNESSYFLGLPDYAWLMLPFATNYVDDQQYVGGGAIVIDGEDVLLGDLASPADHASHILSTCVIIKDSPATARPFLDEVGRRRLHSHVSYLNTLLTKRSPADRQGKVDAYFHSLQAFIDLRRNGAARKPPQTPPAIPAPLMLPKLSLPATLDSASLPRKQIVVSWEVDEFGSVRNLKVLSSCGNQAVDQEALTTVRSHRFGVTWSERGPVPVSSEYTFDLSEDAAK